MSGGRERGARFSRPELTRKTLHLMTAVVPIAWGLGRIEPGTARDGLLLLAAVAILAEATRAGFPAVRRAVDRVAGSLFRPHEQRGLLGATWLAVAMALAVLLFPERSAIAALWAVAVGDAAAALVGSTVTSAATGKSLAGSVACLLTAAIGAWWLAAAPPLSALAIGLAASLAERPRLAIDDNLRVTAAAGLAAWGLGVA